MWTANANRADGVPVKITYNGGIKDTILNQQINGSQWVSLGVFSFAAGTSGNVKIENIATTGYVIADAVRFSKPIECDSISTSLEENYSNLKSIKKLIKIVDVLGRETKKAKNEPLFYIYDDGTVEKRITVE